MRPDHIPGFGENSIIWLLRNVLLGYTECAVRGLLEKVRGLPLSRPPARARALCASWNLVESDFCAILGVGGANRFSLFGSCFVGLK